MYSLLGKLSFMFLFYFLDPKTHFYQFVSVLKASYRLTYTYEVASIGFPSFDIKFFVKKKWSNFSDSSGTFQFCISFPPRHVSRVLYMLKQWDLRLITP